MRGRGGHALAAGRVGLADRQGQRQARAPGVGRNRDEILRPDIDARHGESSGTAVRDFDDAVVGRGDRSGNDVGDGCARNRKIDRIDAGRDGGRPRAGAGEGQRERGFGEGRRSGERQNEALRTAVARDRDRRVGRTGRGVARRVGCLITQRQACRHILRQLDLAVVERTRSRVDHRGEDGRGITDLYGAGTGQHGGNQSGGNSGRDHLRAEGTRIDDGRQFDCTRGGPVGYPYPEPSQDVLPGKGYLVADGGKVIGNTATRKEFTERYIEKYSKRIGVRYFNLFRAGGGSIGNPETLYVLTVGRLE